MFSGCGKRMRRAGVIRECKSVLRKCGGVLQECKGVIRECKGVIREDEWGVLRKCGV